MQKVKSKKAVTKKKTARRAVPYDLIARMAEAGDDVLTIARRIGRVNPGGDPTHTVRAIISGMRTKGWKNESSKLQKLKVERVGRTKKIAPKKGKKKTATKPAPKPIANASTQQAEKTLAAGEAKDE